MLALGWCGRLDEPGAQRHVLLINPVNTLALPLLDSLLLREQRMSQGFRRRAGLASLTVADLLT